MRLALALLLALAAAAPAQAQQRTIYSSLPLSGDYKPQTEDVVCAMRMALEESGRTDVRYVSLNDATRASGTWQPEKVSQNARRAARDPSTVAYLGEFNSGASAISIPILNAAGIMHISPSNTYVGLTRSDGGYPGEPGMYHPADRRTYGRVIPADHTQAHALLAYARERGRKRIALVHDREAYGTGMTRMVRARAAAHGVRIVTVQPAGYRANMSRVARRVRRARPDAMIYGGITQNRATALWRAVHRRMPKIDLFGGDGVAEPAFTERISRAARRRTFITNATLAPESYPGQQFFAGFLAKCGKQPEPYAIYGYEAMALALDALARGGNTREGAVAALFQTRDRASVLGTYSIDAMGDTTLAAYGGYAVSRSGRLTFDRVLHATP